MQLYCTRPFVGGSIHSTGFSSRGAHSLPQLSGLERSESTTRSCGSKTSHPPRARPFLTLALLSPRARSLPPSRGSPHPCCIFEETTPPPTKTMRRKSPISKKVRWGVVNENALFSSAPSRQRQHHRRLHPGTGFTGSKKSHAVPTSPPLPLAIIAIMRYTFRAGGDEAPRTRRTT